MNSDSSPNAQYAVTTAVARATCLTTAPLDRAMAKMLRKVTAAKTYAGHAIPGRRRRMMATR
jgi:hypothetical protein